MDYIITRDGDSEELQHYGVLGMKWGVRRASKKLQTSTDKNARDKAISSLNKHRTKAEAKVGKLEKQHVQLEKDVNRHIQKTDVRAAQIKNKAARIRNKAYGRFVSEKKAMSRLYEAGKMDAKADRMIARSREAKAKIAKNEKMAELFRRGINDIDEALINAGKKYVLG